MQGSPGRARPAVSFHKRQKCKIGQYQLPFRCLDLTRQTALVQYYGDTDRVLGVAFLEPRASAC